MRIAIAADHNGVVLKARLVAWLTEQGHEVDDRGAADESEVVDYPPLCEDVCRRVVAGRADRGIVIGGSGSGETIACNKIRGIRAGLCPDLFTPRSRAGNNDSNVLVVGREGRRRRSWPSRSSHRGWTTPFKGAEHQRRIDQIAALERRRDRSTSERSA